MNEIVVSTREFKSYKRALELSISSFIKKNISAVDSKFLKCLFDDQCKKLHLHILSYSSFAELIMKSSYMSFENINTILIKDF